MYERDRDRATKNRKVVLNVHFVDGVLKVRQYLHLCLVNFNEKRYDEEWLNKNIEKVFFFLFSIFILSIFHSFFVSFFPQQRFSRLKERKRNLNGEQKNGRKRKDINRFAQRRYFINFFLPFFCYSERTFLFTQNGSS